MTGTNPIAKTDLNEAGCFPFHLGLNPRTTAALQRITKAHKFKTRGHPAEYQVAMLAIKFALANPDLFHEWINSLIDYKNHEGIEFQVRAADLAVAPHKIKKHPVQWLPFER
jgi:hypothetical protein